MNESPDTKAVSHPAKFGQEILSVLHGWLLMEAFYQGKRIDKLRVLDPMAGIGGVHALPGRTFGIEIEPEWSDQHPRNQVGDALALPWRAKSFDCIVVSPTYANRMADSHNAKDDSKRIGYRFQLGRMPTEGSSATMQWGEEYRTFHRKAWGESVRVLRPNGLFLLNCSDHIREGKQMRVSAFHCSVLNGLDLECIARRDIPTKRMRFGSNRELRVNHEHVFAFRKPS